MEYISTESFEYIMNKYHDPARPFNGFKRFVRRDELFHADSGDAPDAILTGIRENDAACRHLPHAVRKARAMEYVLAHTRISCDIRDIFPAINMTDRPLLQTLIGDWKKEVFCERIPQVEARRAQLERDGVVTIWPDFDHSVPVWERLLALGLPGILKESEAARASRAWTEEEQAFFEGVRITYEAALLFIGRLHAQACRTQGAEKLAHALQTLRCGAPETFYEALLLSYLYFMISEHIDSLQVRSLSNFDRLFYRFYLHDLNAGVEEESLRSDLAFYFLQFTAIGNYWNQPVYLGGENADGSTVINELSYLFLDVYDKMGIYNPKIQIKVADSTPKSFLLKALDMIRRGHNCIVFVSDSTIRRALMRAGASEEDARLCDVKGCYEYSVVGSYEAGMNYLNLLKPLEYALHEGRDGVTGALTGLVCPAPDEYDSFEALYAAYKQQLLNVIEITRETVNGFEDYLAYINPLSLLSATFPACLASGRDAIGGGAKNSVSMMLFGFLADIVDSLTMIQKYVYEQKKLSLGEWVRILDDNYEGQPLLRARLRADREKYGNNQKRPDALAVDLVDFIVSHVVGKAGSPKRGSTWNCCFHVARQSYTQGAKTAASPNGRLRGEELSKNISASMGQCRQGATAAILSATKLDASSFTGDAALDLGLLPASVLGEEGLEAMYTLLRTFTSRGGHALHINVFDAGMLRDAQAHPEKYSDLQIRVCGWNVLWNNINKEEQDGFIRQAESLA